MIGAEIQHLLCFADAANDRSRKPPPPEKKTRHDDGQWLRWCSHHRERPIQLQEIEECIDVVLSGNGVEDKIEAGSVLLHLRFVLRDHYFMRAQPQCVISLAGRSCKQHY